MKKISVAVIGAGVRGTNAYAPYLLENPTLGQVVAVAEPNEEKRNNFKNRYNIKEENTFYSYKDLLSKDKLADALIIATNDEQHYEPAQMALKKGYHILLEKPMSNKLEEVILDDSKLFDIQVFFKIKKYVKENAPEILTKTGIMVGLGESDEEIYKLMDDVLNVGCDIFTIGQYLQPSRKHVDVEEYVSLEKFEKYKEVGMKKGFRFIASSPLVRSSYKAAEALEARN